jgi:hypothetical protein
MIIITTSTSIILSPVPRPKLHYLLPHKQYPSVVQRWRVQLRTASRTAEKETVLLGRPIPTAPARPFQDVCGDGGGRPASGIQAARAQRRLAIRRPAYWWMIVCCFCCCCRCCHHHTAGFQLCQSEHFNTPPPALLQNPTGGFPPFSLQVLSTECRRSCYFVNIPVLYTTHCLSSCQMIITVQFFILVFVQHWMVSTLTSRTENRRDNRKTIQIEREQMSSSIIF